MLLYVDHINLHVIKMVHGTLFELSTRSSLGIHVHSHEYELLV